MFRPLRDWMIVEAVGRPESGSLVVPEAYAHEFMVNTATESMAYKVIKVGPQAVDYIFPGDIVVIEGRMNVHPIKFNGKVTLITQAQYVALILENKEK